MSSDETQAALSRAHELVESGQLDEARAIVEPILAADQNNADAWWVYAHAVTDPDEGRKALANVLRLDPNYPGAADLMALANETAPAQPTITPIRPPAMPEHLPEPDFAAPDTQEVASAVPLPPVPPVSRGLPVVPIIAVIIIVALVLLVLISQSGGSVTPTPTPTEAVAIISAPTQSIAQAATEAVTEAPTVTALLANATPAVGSTAEATADFTALRGELSQFNILQNGITETATSLGNTVVVSVCSAAGREMRTLLPQVMDALAKQSGSLDANVQAIGASMVNCQQNNTPMLMVAVDIASAQSYANGTLTDSAFAALWKPQ